MMVLQELLDLKDRQEHLDLQAQTGHTVPVQKVAVARGQAAVESVQVEFPIRVVMWLL